jgi:hypothetical protein
VPPPPPKFLRSGKINATFGQNIKILGKFWYVLKKLFLCENYVMLGQNFRMFVEKYLICPKKFFSYVGKKIFGDLANIFGEKYINVQFACSGKLYCAPTNKIRPIRPCILERCL